MPVVQQVKKDNNTYDIRDSRISDINSLVTLNGPQTLNAKTLINPTINSGSGTNDKITVEGKIQSTNPVKLESELISFKPISIQYSKQGTETGADDRARWTVYPTSSDSGTVPSRLSLTVVNDGASPVVEIGRSNGPSSEVQKLVLSTNTTPDSNAAPILEKYNGQNRIFQWTFPAANGTLALDSDITSLTSKVNSNYNNTVKKDASTQDISGSLNIKKSLNVDEFLNVTGGVTIRNGHLEIQCNGESHEGGDVDAYYHSKYIVVADILNQSTTQIYFPLTAGQGKNSTETFALRSDNGSIFYAPTTPGTTSQVLMGNPSGKPQWQNLSTVVSKGFTLDVFLEDSTGGDISEGYVKLRIFYANGSTDSVTITMPSNGSVSKTFYNVSGYTLESRGVQGPYREIYAPCTGNRAKLSESINQFGIADASADLFASENGTSYLMLSDVSYEAYFEK